MTATMQFFVIEVNQLIFSSPRFPMFLYGIPMSRSGWPANV